MRLRKAFVVACLLLMAIHSIVVVTLADFGTAPAWSPAWPAAPAMTTPGGPDKANIVGDIPGTSSVSKPPDTGNGEISIEVPPPLPMPTVFGTDVSIIGSDLIGKTSGHSGVLPVMPLVELPHDNGMNIISVPSGSVILPNGDIQHGSSIGHLMPPMPPGYWDGINGTDLHTNMPTL